MRLSQLEQRILHLTTPGPLLRRTVMTQCKLAGHEAADVMDALLELLDADLIERDAIRRDKHGIEQPFSYTATPEGVACLRVQVDRYRFTGRAGTA